jgi:hypothetical protein
MTDKKFTVRPGQTVRVELSKKDAQGTEGKREREHKAVLFPDEDSDLYVRRGPVAMALYDLGTRLRSVPPDTVFNGLRRREYLSQETASPDNAHNYFNEYVEVAYEVQGIFHPVTPEQEEAGELSTLEVTSEEWERLDKMLLGSRAPLVEGEPHDPFDPFGFSFANGSGRALTNVAPVPYSLMYFGAIYIGDSDFGVSSDPHIVDPDHPVAGWDFRQPKEADAEERWNPHNLGDGSYLPDNFAQRALEFKNKKAKGALGVQIHGYEYFSTGDPDTYKITTEPSFEAEEKKFSIKGRDNRIYLRPTLTGLLFGSTSVLSTWAARQPTIYPTINGLAPSACGIKRSEYSHYEAASAAPMALSQLYLSPPAVPAHTLVAAIAQGHTVYYVWRRAAQEESTGLSLFSTTTVGTCDM